MENETLDNPAQPETEAPESSTEETLIESDEQPEVSADESETEGQATEPEFEEVEFEGNKYKLPKELKSALMMEKDYRQKTSAVAEERRQIAAEREAVSREIQINEQMISDKAQFSFVTNRLEQLAQADPYQMTPEQQQAFMLEQMQLNHAKQALEGRMNERRAEIEANQKQNDAKLISHAMQELSKPDERLGWSGTYDQTARQSLTTFGKELGFSDEELGSIRNPTAIKTLHLAKIGLETLKKQRAAVAAPKTEAKPVPQVGGAKAKVTPRPESMDFKQYKAWREKNSKVM